MNTTFPRPNTVDPAPAVTAAILPTAETAAGCHGGGTDLRLRQSLFTLTRGPSGLTVKLPAPTPSNRTAACPATLSRRAE